MNDFDIDFVLKIFFLVDCIAIKAYISWYPLYFNSCREIIWDILQKNNRMDYTIINSHIMFGSITDENAIEYCIISLKIYG